MRTGRIGIMFTPEERQALYAAAEKDLRDIRDQARYYVRLALEERGLLKPIIPSKPHPTPEAARSC